MMQKIIYLFLFSFFFAVPIDARDLIAGNANPSTSTTFTTPVGIFKREDSGGTFYAGALTAGAQEFSVARYVPGFGTSPFFFGITPAQVILNNTANQTSPLYNAAVSLLSPIAGGRCALVLNGSAQTLYVIDDLPGLQVISLNPVNDAANGPSSGIVALLSPMAEAVFAAVNGSGQAGFGTGNSGIAFFTTASQDVTTTTGSNQTETKRNRVIIQADLQTPVVPAQVRAAPLSVASSAVYITDPAASMATHFIDMHWSEHLKTLYVAYDAVGASGAQDGVRSVAAAQITGGVMTILPLAPDSVFVSGNQNEIIGGIAPNAAVTAQFVRTMRTTTFLDYLIIAGANGLPAATESVVYALPLVNRFLPSGVMANPTQDLPVQGTLADVTVAPVVDYTPTNTSPSIPLFGNRRFSIAATTNEGIYTTSTDVAQVGQGAIQAGPIAQMIVNGDTVFVVVNEPNADQVAGIYYSQAFFNASGVIIGWTPWAAACGFIGAPFFAGYIAPQGTFIIGTGSSSATANTFYQMTWGFGTSPGLADLVSLFNTFYSAQTGGLEKVRYFSPIDPGILDCGIVIGVGLNSVVLAQTAITQSGTFTPLGGGYSANLQQYPTGSITSSISSTTQTLSFSNGALSSLGALQAVEIGTAGSNAWLFVGGVNGLAVVANADGSGWDPSTGLSTGFYGLTEGMAFKQIGNYSFVRKLMADSGFLYVLTDSLLDRIDLSSSDFSTGILVTITVATGLNAPALQPLALTPTLIDVIVSGQFALLATSSGLISSASAADIRTVTSAAQVGWQAVTIPPLFLTPLQLYAISSTGRAQDVTTSPGGQIYVLNGSPGTDRAFLNRYFVQGSTIVPVQDWLAQGVLGNMGTYSALRNVMATDGALFLSGESKTAITAAIGFTGFFMSGMPLMLGIEAADYISSILRNGASGSWLFGGDFGLRVNE